MVIILMMTMMMSPGIWLFTPISQSHVQHSVQDHAYIYTNTNCRYIFYQEREERTIEIKPSMEISIRTLTILPHHGSENCLLVGCWDAKNLHRDEPNHTLQIQCSMCEVRCSSIQLLLMWFLFFVCMNIKTHFWNKYFMHQLLTIHTSLTSLAFHLIQWWW